MDKNRILKRIRIILAGFEEIDLAYVFGSFWSEMTIMISILPSICPRISLLIKGLNFLKSSKIS